MQGVGNYVDCILKLILNNLVCEDEPLALRVAWQEFRDGAGDDLTLSGTIELILANRRFP